jgi:N-carbamoyl-L-amino-acid hydrolase
MQIETNLRTDGERLKASLLELARIGATPAGGVTRLSLSDEDKAARDLFANWCRDAGLAVRVDDLGTTYARLEGVDPSLPPLLIGSHLDSVPLGGRFDGPLGVTTGLEVLRTICDAGIRPRRSIELVNFTNEEGVRFEPAMLASGVLAGRFDAAFVHDRRDPDGKRLGDELARIGYLGDSANRPGAIHAYLELHIEQGPVLEAEGLPLAAVDGILGVQWFDVTLTGQAQHAGPSPMKGRRDSMVAASRIVVALRELVLEYGDPAVANVGRLRPYPGVMNQIPGQVNLGANVRHPTLEGLEELGGRTQEMMRRIAAEEGCEVKIDVIWNIAPTHFDRAIVDTIAEEIERLGFSPRRMTAGAGHDAKYIAEIAPAAMVFVRTIGGKSHCESEAIEWEDARLGADVLLRTALRLAD